MIAILISMALMGQTDSLATGAKIRHESNKMIMGMQNVPYDVADVLNGSNYTVEQATAIAAQRRAAANAKMNTAIREMNGQYRDAAKKSFKMWGELDKFYEKIADGSMIIPDQERPTARGHIRSDIEATTKFLQPIGLNAPSRNLRKAAETHIKKAEAALAVLDKQGSPPEEKQNPGTGPGK